MNKQQEPRGPAEQLSTLQRSVVTVSVVGSDGKEQPILRALASELPSNTLLVKRVDGRDATCMAYDSNAEATVGFQLFARALTKLQPQYGRKVRLIVEMETFTAEEIAKMANEDMIRRIVRAGLPPGVDPEMDAIGGKE